MLSFKEFKLLNEEAFSPSKIDGDYAIGTDKCNSDKRYVVIPLDDKQYQIIQLFKGNKTGVTNTDSDGIKKNFLPVIDPESWENREVIKTLL